MKSFLVLTGTLMLTVMTIAMGISDNSKGVELSLDSTLLQGEAYKRIKCEVKGNSVTVRTVVVSKVKVGGQASQLLAVTVDSPEVETKIDHIWANGSLRDNTAVVFVDFNDGSGGESDVIACQVSYTTRSGQTGETFALAGLGKLPTLQPAEQSGRESLMTSSKVQPAPPKIGSSYISELWFLGQKITNVEDKFETLRERLDRRLTEDIDSVQKRANTLENSVLERVNSVETDFSSRVSRLEDRVSSMLLSQPPDTGSDGASTLGDMERRLEKVSERLDQLNATKSVPSRDGDENSKTTTCERGMGFDMTKNYPPYLIMDHQTVEKQILCDTHTDGGGWIIFQRRTVGDVDFYKDWSSYKNGFGSLTGDFWMGNDALHTLTDLHPYELRVDMIYKAMSYYVVYSSFRIEDEENKYKLRLGSVISGNSDDGKHGLFYHNDIEFSSFDRDNDPDGRNCAITYHGAWWYKNCHNSGLNGMWGVDNSKGVYWHTGSAALYPYFTELKIRRVRSSESG